jgi:hypothetical protein
MARNKLEIINEDIEECYNILTGLEVEREISVYLQEFDEVKNIHEQSKMWHKRLKALLILKDAVENPSFDLEAVITIRKG